MKTRLIFKLLLVLTCAKCISANQPEDTEIESITGTREPDEITTTEKTAVATTEESFRQSRWNRYGFHGRGDDDHDDHDDHYVYDEHHDIHPEEMEMMEQPKNAGGGDYLGGYYDFLINEGSYKFWAVFQLGTAALLIYSGFAALYYAKVNPSTTSDYEDYLLRRRRSVQLPPQERTFLGLSPETFQRVIDAIAREFH